MSLPFVLFQGQHRERDGEKRVGVGIGRDSKVFLSLAASRRVAEPAEGAGDLVVDRTMGTCCLKMSRVEHRSHWGGPPGGGASTLAEVSTTQHLRLLLLFLS